MANYSSRGSLWNRWDLHVHTPSSYDYANRGLSDEQIVECLTQAGVRVAAITDHHRIDVERFRKLQALSQGKITLLPGIELRDEHGTAPIHYICIFPEDCDLDHVWTTVQGRLGLTPKNIGEKGGDDRIYVPIRDGATIARALGGIVSIHAGTKSNSIENIRNHEQFQQRIKYDITREFVDVMEIGQVKDIDVHLKTIFPATGLKKPLVLCSDNDDALDYRVKAPLWFRADPTFRGLLMVLREPCDRVFIGERPPDVVRVEQNRTKYISSISFQRRNGAPPDELWFNGCVEFNPGLVAIVGNKGSGKSALSDTIGLLGATKNANAFSFLRPERFRHLTGGFAGFFDATLEWESGDTQTKCLADEVKPEEVERLKYLPQDHVEKVCTELEKLGAEGFEQELKAVIFSHVPEAERLGYNSLEQLVQFQTGEKEKRIDSIRKQLSEVNRSRAALESHADPTKKRELQEKIARRRLELDAHGKTKPTEVANPADNGNAPVPDKAFWQSLSHAEEMQKKITSEIACTEDALRNAERRQAVARRLLEKLDNFEKDFAVHKDSLVEDATELGVTVERLASATFDKSEPSRVREAAARAITDAKKRLDSTDPSGLRRQLLDVEKDIRELQSQLDAPSRAYQAYLMASREWNEAHELIVGSEKDPESLRGLEAALRALDQTPDQITKARDEQLDLALQIHAEKIAQADIYGKLYESVQRFINSHILSKDRLKLEFRAELVEEDFVNRFLDLLALNRRGSFMGVDEGRARARAIAAATKWGDAHSVRQFLVRLDEALHADQREGQVGGLLLKDQLAKGKKPTDVFELLYGLDYVRTRYLLRWEGKEVSMLSAGERGTLLLVFYLLIDKDDMPLIIDQPEGNLDNHTVAKVLVECIKEARKRRQIFIVTHNPNLAVVCDADQVIHASIDKTKGNQITYTSGSLENPKMSKFITDVLEGTRWAFDVRGEKYKVGEAQG